MKIQKLLISLIIVGAFAAFASFVSPPVPQANAYYQQGKIGSVGKTDNHKEPIECQCPDFLMDDEEVNVEALTGYNRFMMEAIAIDALSTSSTSAENIVKTMSRRITFCVNKLQAFQAKLNYHMAMETQAWSLVEELRMENERLRTQLKNTHGGGGIIAKGDKK